MLRKTDREMINRLILLLIFFLPSIICVAQNRLETGTVIKNTNADLKRNSVSSITHTKYFYKDTKKRLTEVSGRKVVTEIFDSIGRNIEVIYYNDSSGHISSRAKYYYADTIGKSIYRMEYYNNKDSLQTVNVAKEKNGQMVYLVLGEGVSCFGNYKFVYNDKGLIDEAIWYEPKRGIWANEHMIAYFTTKLNYTFR